MHALLLLTYSRARSSCCRCARCGWLASPVASVTYAAAFYRSPSPPSSSLPSLRTPERRGEVRAYTLIRRTSCTCIRAQIVRARRAHHQQEREESLVMRNIIAGTISHTVRAHLGCDDGCDSDGCGCSMMTATTTMFVNDDDDGDDVDEVSACRAGFLLASAAADV